MCSQKSCGRQQQQNQNRTPLNITVKYCHAVFRISVFVTNPRSGRFRVFKVVVCYVSTQPFSKAAGMFWHHLAFFKAVGMFWHHLDFFKTVGMFWHHLAFFQGICILWHHPACCYGEAYYSLLMAQQNFSHHLPDQTVFRPRRNHASSVCLVS